MSTLLDHRLGLKKETTYGTPVTVDRFYVRTDDSKHSWDPRGRQGAGVASGGRRSMLGSRYYVPTGQGEVTVKVPLESKQAGVLLDLALGVSTVNSITGGSQINFHTGITGTVLPSATIQFVDVMNDGTEVVVTYAGCTATKVVIEQPNEDAVTLEVTFDALTRTKATAAAVKSYSFGVIFDAYQGTCAWDGTLTVPTTTALASGGTAFPHFRSWKVEIDQKASIDRWNINAGVRAQPTVGMPDIKFSGEVEHTVDTLPVAMDAGSKKPWYATYTTTEAISAGFSQLQVVAPNVVLTKGAPEPKVDGSTSTFSVDGEIKNDGTNRDLYVCYRTLDTAL